MEQRDKLEASFIANGKAYGYDGDKLREYVEERLAEAVARDERAQKRELEKREVEESKREEEIEKLRQQLREQQGLRRSDAESDEEETVQRRSPRVEKRKVVLIDMPKYDGKQGVTDFLELFEEVAIQNEFPREKWLIRLRIALTGSKLEGSCYGCTTYDEAKKEIVAAHGTTPHKAWKNLLALTQQSEESFHHYVVRVARAVIRWSQLATRKETSGCDTESLASVSLEDCEATQEALVKQIVVSSGTLEQRAFLMERRCYEMRMEKFLEVGTAYQGAHERKNPSRPEQKAGPLQTSAQCLVVGVKELETKLASMTMEHRIELLIKERLCRNCLKTGHRAIKCFSRSKCDKCDRKHHKLFHLSEVEARQLADATKIGSYSCGVAGGVHLMTGIGEVCVQKKARVRIFLDPGAQASFVSHALVEGIRPRKAGSGTINIKGFGSDRVQRTLNKFQLTVTGVSGDIPMEVWEQDSLGVEMEAVDAVVNQHWERHGISLSDRAGGCPSSDIHLLIGADYSNQFLHEKVQIGGATAWRSEIGWILSGPNALGRHSEPDVNVSFVYTHPVERLWEQDDPAVSEPHLPSFPLIKKKEHYEIGLLWKGSERPGDNKKQAMAALKSSLKRLETKPDAKSQYEGVLINEYAELEAIEQDPDPDSRGYYLPHHAVIREEATTTKVRVVLNASARASGQKSLNDVLLPGPSLLPDLVGLLMRFREASIAFQADVKKAFFMVGVQEEDRPFLRFLWPNREGVMVTWRLTRLPFGVNCSPFLLSAVISHHLKSLQLDASESDMAFLVLLQRSMYVDDCISSLDEPPEAAEFKEISCKALAKAGMELRKWNVLGQSDAKESKVLGLHWSLEADELRIATPSVDDQPDVWTRRSLLQHVAAFFDPMGIGAPLLLTGKILLQQTWKAGTDWDDPLPTLLNESIRAWWGVALQLPKMPIPRWIGTRLNQAVELHVFADASEKAMGACVYVAHGGVAHLVYGKTKVAPVKVQTLARLELQAMWKGAQAVEFVSQQLRLQVSSVHGWSDSLTALYWIKGQPYRWKTYVANRVAAVQKISQRIAIHWHHCPGKENPADIASRGARRLDEISDGTWLRGPVWICDHAAWPGGATLEPTSDSVVEVKLNVVQAEVDPPYYPFWKSFSSWTRLKAVVGRVLSWKYRNLSRAELLAQAETLLFSICQRCEFPQERVALAAGKGVSHQSKLAQFQPLLGVDNLIRATTRLDFADVPEDAKTPIILPRHPLTVLMLRSVHKSRLHQGVEGCMAYVRRCFLVLSGRRMLRDIKQSCVVCRRFDAQPASEVPAPLPQDRVQHQRAFAVVGIDHTGPVLVRDGTVTKKSWILLFVCATTRAVHLEVVMSLSASDVLLAYRRFMAMYGEPAIIRSDNGTAFAAASKQLSVDWRFNPPSAPWHGGFFERLVAVIKAPLRKVLGRSLVSVVELRTVLAEVQAIVNDRPLTHVSTFDEPLPLTPNMLLGRQAGVKATMESSLSAEHAVKRLQYISRLRTSIDQRWSEEYLTSLRLHAARHANNVKVGNVVLLADNQKKRVMWKMALVEELFPGRDGKFRVARVKVGNLRLLRPVQKLVPMELKQSGDPVEQLPLPEPLQPMQPPVQQQPQTRLHLSAAPPSSSVSTPGRTRTRAVHIPIRYR